MIIWKGWGWTIAVLAFLSLVGMEVVVEAAAGNSTYYQDHGWPKLAGFLFAAVLVRGFNALLVHFTKDEDAHWESSLFFMPMALWPLVCGGLGLVFLSVG